LVFSGETDRRIGYPITTFETHPSAGGAGGAGAETTNSFLQLFPRPESEQQPPPTHEEKNDRGTREDGRGLVAVLRRPVDSGRAVPEYVAEHHHWLARAVAVAVAVVVRRLCASPLN
jgi:hypothetical protein